MVELETIRQFVDKNARNGHYPNTQAALRNLHRYRKEFGLAGAFHQVGWRWLVNREMFYELIAKPRPRNATTIALAMRPPKRSPKHGAGAPI